MLDIILLGTGGTQPLPERALAAACITVGGSNLLLDCGEGTQTAARRAGVSIFRMDAILLTHYHGDHIFGLPGIWQTMAAQGRTAPLVMAGPPGLTDVVRTFYAVAGPLPFELRLKELPDCKGEFEVPAGCVQAFPLKHRVPCCGYAFTLPRAGKFDPQRAKAAGIPVRYWSTLQSGQPVGGFLPSQVLGPPRRGLKVVYATDTRPCAALRRAAQDADLLLMDSTYADDADLPKAKLYGHSTCRETGTLAAEANVCRLWLTHYSAAVTDLAPGLAAAQQAFPTAAAGVLWLCFGHPAAGSGLVAVLTYGDDSTQLRIPLDTDHRYDIDTGYYTIHLVVENGGIRFVESPCPDHTCESFGVLTKQGDWAACLPARASVTVE